MDMTITQGGLAYLEGRSIGYVFSRWHEGSQNEPAAPGRPWTAFYPLVSSGTRATEPKMLEVSAFLSESPFSHHLNPALVAELRALIAKV